MELRQKGSYDNICITYYTSHSSPETSQKQVVISKQQVPEPEEVDYPSSYMCTKVLWVNSYKLM